MEPETPVDVALHAALVAAADALRDTPPADARDQLDAALAAYRAASDAYTASVVAAVGARRHG